MKKKKNTTPDQVLETMPLVFTRSRNTVCKPKERHTTDELIKLPSAGIDPRRAICLEALTFQIARATSSSKGGLSVSVHGLFKRTAN